MLDKDVCEHLQNNREIFDEPDIVDTSSDSFHTYSLYVNKRTYIKGREIALLLLFFLIKKN